MASDIIYINENILLQLYANIIRLYVNIILVLLSSIRRGCPPITNTVVFRSRKSVPVVAIQTNLLDRSSSKIFVCHMVNILPFMRYSLEFIKGTSSPTKY